MLSYKCNLKRLHRTGLVAVCMYRIRFSGHKFFLSRHGRILC
jgi:hypothetical protein